MNSELKQMSDEKVSIVIPTRHRWDTLAKSLLTVINQTYRNIEVIVSNNGNSPETRRVVEALGDARVRCVEPSAPLSMSHNFEFAMQHVTGEWIVLIGDDDGILPSGIERAMHIMKESGGDALASLNCVYQWPIDQRPQDGVYLSVPMTSGWSWRDSRTAIQRVLARDLSFNETPTTYTGGIVRARLYDRIRQVRGTFYQSQIPDLFSSFALLSSIDRYVYTNETLMVAGVSSHSYGQAALRVGEHSFNQDPNIAFHPDLPLPEEGNLSFSFQALIYESYLQSMYLRAEPPITALEDQVTAILAYANTERRRIAGGEKAYDASVRWAHMAAAYHKLDLSRILHKSRRLSPRQVWSQYRQIIKDFHARYVVDDKLGLQISDVYQASLAAEAIKFTRPSRIASYRRTLERKMSKLSG